MRRAAVSLRAGIVLAVWSLCAVPGFAQPGLVTTPFPPPVPTLRPAADAGCPTPAPASPVVTGLQPSQVGIDPAASQQTSDLQPSQPGNVRRSLDVPSGLGEALGTIVGDFAAFPSDRTAAWLGVGAGLALAGTASDDTFAGRTGPGWRGFRAGADMGGAPAHMALALGTFAVGKLSGSREVSALGFQFIRANVMAQALTHTMKVTTRRIRPDGTGLSFPSGHTSTSFAAATVVQQRYGWKAGVPAYLLASYVAASRVHDRRHFVSDVMFGAGLGIAIGLTVTRPDSRVRPFVPAPVVTRGGAAAVWSMSW